MAVENRLQKILGEHFRADPDSIIRLIASKVPEGERELVLQDLGKITGLHKKFWDDRLKVFCGK